MLAALSGCSARATGSPSAAPTDTTTTWIDLAYLRHSVTGDMATVTGANVTYSTALNAAFADLSSQERKLTLDEGAIQAPPEVRTRSEQPMSLSTKAAKLLSR